MGVAWRDAEGWWLLPQTESAQPARFAVASHHLLPHPLSANDRFAQPPAAGAAASSPLPLPPRPPPRRLVRNDVDGCLLACAILLCCRRSYCHLHVRLVFCAMLVGVQQCGAAKASWRGTTSWFRRYYCEYDGDYSDGC